MMRDLNENDGYRESDLDHNGMLLVIKLIKNILVQLRLKAGIDNHFGDTIEYMKTINQLNIYYFLK